jgi:outer membrane biosynthesis protein TonB
MRKATAISAGLHAAVLLWATLSFSGKTFDVTPAESLPVDLVSEKDFSQMTKGVKDAPKVEMPKPLAEKKAEEPPKPIEESKPKITEKKEVQAAKETSPPPEPQRQPDPIAEKIKQQDEPKQQAKLDQPLPPKKPPQKQPPKFEPDKIAALLDKRDPQRAAAAGPELTETSLGAANATAAQLSQSEIDALKSRLRQCWNPPVGATDVAKLYVVFRVLFRRDGTILNNPVLVEAPPSQVGPVLAESAKRALLQCQPYTMLKPEHYDMWKDMQITFDPREMFGG